MPWARLDDMLPMHPKIRAASDAAFRLHISAICWANMHLTNGQIDRCYLRFISDVRRPAHCAAELVKLSLWDEREDGWQIHDYLEYQPSADKVLRERKLAALRRARWLAKGDSVLDGVEDAVSDGVQDGVDDDVGDGVDDASTSHTHVSTSSVGAETNDRARAPRNRRTDLTQATQQAIAARTGTIVPAQLARAIAASILGSEPVRDQVAYVVAAINRDPKPERFLPTSVPPPLRHQPRRPDQDEINNRGANQARHAINRKDNPT